MSKKRAKISYDKEAKVLSVELNGAKSVDSDIQGNVVIDYGKNGKIARINLYDFNFDSFKDNLKKFKTFSRQTGIAVAVR